MAFILCFCVFSKFPQGMWVIFIIQKTIILKKCYVVVKQHQGQRVLFCKTSGKQPGAQHSLESGTRDPCDPAECTRSPWKRRVFLPRAGGHDMHLAPAKTRAHGKGKTYLRRLQRDRLRGRTTKRQISAQKKEEFLPTQAALKYKAVYSQHVTVHRCSDRHWGVFFYHKGGRLALIFNYASTVPFADLNRLYT